MKNSVLLKEYQAYSGLSFSGLCLRYFILLLFLLLASFFFIFSDKGFFISESFLLKNSAILTGGLCSNIIIFSSSQGVRFNTLRKKECYLLTIKNRFACYKKSYIISYFSNCLFYTIFISIFYIIFFIQNGFSSQQFLEMLTLIEIVLFTLALMPLFFRIKKASFSVYTSWIVIVIFLILLINLMLLKTDYFVIPLTFIFPPLMYFSNHRWLKRIKKLYLEE